MPCPSRRELITGEALSTAERVWLLGDPLAVSLRLAMRVWVGHWDPGLARWLSRGGVEGAHVGASLVAELMRRDEALDRAEIHRLCVLVARLLDEWGQKRVALQRPGPRSGHPGGPADRASRWLPGLGSCLDVPSERLKVQAVAVAAVRAAEGAVDQQLDFRQAKMYCFRHYGD